MIKMATFCEMIKAAIADERKGVEDYSKIMEEVAKMPREKDTILVWALLQDIKADEQKHGIALEKLKDVKCQEG